MQTIYTDLLVVGAGLAGEQIGGASCRERV